MSKKPRNKKYNPRKNERARVESNLQKHTVIFTVSLGKTYFINRVNPKAPSFISNEAKNVFDPDSKTYSSMRFNWNIYPVVALKNKFGKFDKLRIIDLKYDLVNATWQDAIESALVEMNRYLGEVEPRWRMNCGVVFAIDKAPISVEKLEQILEFDKNFKVWDPDREIRTSEEMKLEDLELAEKLEQLMGVSNG